MPASSSTREPKAEEVKKEALNAWGSLRVHWPEYLMEAGESAIYLFSACAAATLLWHPASPIERYLPSDAVRRMLMGLAMGATIVAIVVTPWGKQSGAHFNPAVTFTFYRLGKVALPDALFYSIAQLAGAVTGVALASLLLRGAPADKSVRYAATLPGIYGDRVAFAAELAISFILMSAILFASNHRILAPYTHHFAAILVAGYIAFESPLSGMSTNPARTFGPALYASYWHALWIYFTAPPLGMLAAAEVFLMARRGRGPFCAKLHHHNDKRCIFCHSESGAPRRRAPRAQSLRLPGCR
ncbi:MAG TPA: aquaporin [Bryobacteraceae bacterium]|nr:aquaporin [Bryobacteraceae bacterium]